MKETIAALVLILTFVTVSHAQGGNLYMQQIQISDQTWQIDMQLMTSYDIHIANTGHCTVYVSNYYFDHYNGSLDTDPNIPGRIMWTVLLPGKSLDLKDIFGPLFAVCAKGHATMLGLVITTRTQ